MSFTSRIGLSLKGARLMRLSNLSTMLSPSPSTSIFKVIPQSMNLCPPKSCYTRFCDDLAFNGLKPGSTPRVCTVIGDAWQHARENEIMLHSIKKKRLGSSFTNLGKKRVTVILIVITSLQHANLFTYYIYIYISRSKKSDRRYLCISLV